MNGRLALDRLQNLLLGLSTYGATTYVYDAYLSFQRLSYHVGILCGFTRSLAQHHLPNAQHTSHTKQSGRKKCIDSILYCVWAKIELGTASQCGSMVEPCHISLQDSSRRLLFRLLCF